VEGEFALANAVGEFLKEEVRAGSFKGNCVLNLEEQLRMRCLKEGEGDKRLRVLFVGASQIGKLSVELNRTHGEKVNVIGFVKIEMEPTIMGVINEMEKRKHGADVVIVSGPTNSLVRHDREGERKFGGERMVKFMRNKDSDDEWRVTYHMTDPVKITMTEKADLVDRQVDMLESVRKTVGDKVKLMHVTMFPRFL
jgi:hypothetical protein